MLGSCLILCFYFQIACQLPRVYLFIYLFFVVHSDKHEKENTKTTTSKTQSMAVFILRVNVVGLILTKYTKYTKLIIKYTNWINYQIY